MAKTKATPSPSAAATDPNGPVLILGATSSLGQQLIQQLRQAKRAVRTYIRNVPDADAIELTGATVQIGSLIDQPRLARALEGVSGVLWAVSARPNMMPADIDMTEHKSLRALLEVLKESSIPLVFCSAMGTLDPASNPLLSKILDAKRKAELALEETKLP